MKVLQINIVCGRFSTGVIATSIANELQNNGDECWIAYEGSEGTWYPQNYRIGNIWVQRIHRFIFDDLFDAQGYGSYFATRRFLKWVDSYRPDIIHLHNIHGSYINYPLLFSYIRKRNIPVVWTIHDCWTTTGHCPHFFSVNCDKWRTECYDCPIVKLKKLNLFDRSRANYKAKEQYFNMPKKMILVPVSKWMERITNHGILKKYPSRVIYNGIDLNVFHSTKSSLREDMGLSEKFVLLGVASSWNKEKGLFDYYELANKLGEDFKIVLVGLSQIQINSLPSNIIGVGRTHNETELAQYYTMADVVTSLSYGESMGLTPVEGMACGTPAIVYDNTAQPELVTPETGMVVETGNIQKLEEAVRALRTSISQDSKLWYEACVVRALQYFDKKRQYSKYLNVYNEILDVEPNE